VEGESDSATVLGGFFVLFQILYIFWSVLFCLLWIITCFFYTVTNYILHFIIRMSIS